MPPYKRSDWNGLLSLVNDGLENPPAGCGPAQSPLPLVRPHHRWSRRDILDVQAAIMLTSDTISFAPLPLRQRWSKSLIDEIVFAIPQMWANCGGSSPYCTQARLDAELAASGQYDGAHIGPTVSGSYDTGWEYAVPNLNTVVCRASQVFYGPNPYWIVPRFRGRQWQLRMNYRTSANQIAQTTLAAGELEESGLVTGASSSISGTLPATGNPLDAGPSFALYVLTTEAECVNLRSGNGRGNPADRLGPVCRDWEGKLAPASGANDLGCLGFTVDGTWTGYFDKLWYITSGDLRVPTPLMVEEYQTEATSLLVPGAKYYLSATWSGMITRHAPRDSGQYVVPVGTAKTPYVLAVEIGSPTPTR